MKVTYLSLEEEKDEFWCTGTDRKTGRRRRPWILPGNSGAVSYTHLDVYKRQTWSMPGEKNPRAISWICGKSGNITTNGWKERYRPVTMYSTRWMPGRAWKQQVKWQRSRPVGWPLAGSLFLHIGKQEVYICRWAAGYTENALCKKKLEFMHKMLPLK